MPIPVAHCVEHGVEEKRKSLCGKSSGRIPAASSTGTSSLLNFFPKSGSLRRRRLIFLLSFIKLSTHSSEKVSMVSGSLLFRTAESFPFRSSKSSQKESKSFSCVILIDSARDDMTFPPRTDNGCQRIGSWLTFFCIYFYSTIQKILLVVTVIETWHNNNVQQVVEKSR